MIPAMLREHCQNVECSASMSAEIGASHARPRLSRIQEELLSTLKGDTQFSLVLPDDVAVDLWDINYFKQHHNATLLGGTMLMA